MSHKAGEKYQDGGSMFNKMSQDIVFIPQEGNSGQKHKVTQKVQH